MKEELKKQPATALLLLFNILIFVLVEMTGTSQDALHMRNCGAVYVPYILEKGEIWRLFVSMFLHFGMEHMLNNLLLLFVLGTRLERTVGKSRFLCIYLLGGLAGNLLSLFVEIKTGSFSISAGASGAVYALMGALLFVLLKNKGKVQDLSVRQMAILAACSLYFGLVSTGINQAAHIGGIVSGFLLAPIFFRGITH